MHFRTGRVSNNVCKFADRIYTTESYIFLYSIFSVVYKDLHRVYLTVCNGHVKWEQGMPEFNQQMQLLQPSTMVNDDTFNFTKKIAMWQLSSKLTDSKSLARSVLL